MSYRSPSSDSTLTQLIVLVISISVLCGLAQCGQSGCGANEDDARRALDASGYTDIHIGDTAWFRCGEDDSFSRNFSAKNPLGKQVEGVVCCGWSKGCTVRY